MRSGITSSSCRDPASLRLNRGGAEATRKLGPDNHPAVSTTARSGASRPDYAPSLVGKVPPRPASIPAMDVDCPDGVSMRDPGIVIPACRAVLPFTEAGPVRKPVSLHGNAIERL